MENEKQLGILFASIKPTFLGGWLTHSLVYSAVDYAVVEVATVAVGKLVSAFVAVFPY